MGPERRIREMKPRRLLLLGDEAAGTTVEKSFPNWSLSDL